MGGEPAWAGKKDAGDDQRHSEIPNANSLTTRLAQVESDPGQDMRDEMVWANLTMSWTCDALEPLTTYRRMRARPLRTRTA